MSNEGPKPSDYVKVLLLGLAIAAVLYFTLWVKYLYPIHTFLEAVCIFIAAAAFLIVWNTVNKVPHINSIFGFGFLAVAIFDIGHAFYFIGFNNFNIGYYDIAPRFWIAGRFAEAIIFMLTSLKTNITKINKKIALTVTLTLSLSIALLILINSPVLPILKTEEGITKTKKVFEYIIIVMTVLSLYFLRNNSDNKKSLSYRHMFMALLIVIPAELLFSCFSSVYSFTFAYGHVLKMLYYYYIYKSVFVSSIEYPYEKLQIENMKLEEAYRQLEENKREEERRQAILMEQEKLALMGQMGAGIVHETRNYLTTIMGSCQLIELLTQEELIIKHLKKINKNINDINRMMSQFLFMSKPREMELLEISMYDLLNSIESLIMSSSLVKKVDVLFETTKEERYLLCDEGQINQVILNLCKNAVEAMEDMPDAKLSINTSYDEFSNEICIRVSDNGKGIAAGDLEKIDTPFFTTKNNGTGLGLYTCYQIIKEHKGKIQVSSQLAKGTSFLIKLPCLNEEDDEHANI